MTDRIITKLSQSRAGLFDVIESLTEPNLDRRDSEGWSIRQIVTHLLNAEEDHCRVIAVGARGDLSRLPEHFDLDAHNASRLEARGELSLPELLAALVAQRQRTEALYVSVRDAGQLDVTVPHPALGEQSLSAIFRVIALHEKAHTQEIRALVPGQ